jgi:Ca2+-transporting ATPase
VISVFDILVGDLVRLEAGDVMPADGILVDGLTIKM